MAKDKPKGGKKEKKKAEFRVSIDLTKLALNVVKKFQSDFPDIGVENIMVIEVLNVDKAEYLAKTRAVTEPWATVVTSLSGGNETSNKLCYIIEVNRDRCLAHGFYNDKEQRHLKLLMFHELKHIPIGGCVKESPAYKQIESHDTEDFLSCLLLAGVKGDIMWQYSDKIPDILATTESQQKAESRLEEEKLARDGIEMPEPDSDPKEE